MKKNLLEKVGLTLSFIGLALVFQPFSSQLLYYGFILLGVGGFTYVYSTYLPNNPGGDVGPKTMIRWLVTLVGVVVFFVMLSIYLVPLLVV
ncbi:hypothetical protein HRbin02_00292 [Candidatus Calditenuaceae archaeon HR02]|nr:hypothetical protein HRbin02_00292 [Candidatus Calditenuaceae archaeon HR02]